MTGPEGRAGGVARADRIAADWIAVDWGTSRLRAWALSDEGRILASAESADGMGGLDRAGFEPALLSLAGGWLAPGRATPVLICGMAGSRQGWIEAPYRAVPCAPVARDGLAVAPVRDARLAVRILPGLSQSAPPDVMRGEETQIAGVIARDPGFDGVVCLPGTHSKWARVSAGEVVGFQSFMTGEVFALLAGQSVLRHSLGATGWDEAAFAEAVLSALARPEALAARLFAIRASELLTGPAPGAARARLSGLLIGSELAAARPWWLGQRVAIVGSGAIAGPYRTALGLLGVTAEVQDGETAALAGLIRARLLLKEDLR